MDEEEALFCGMLQRGALRSQVFAAWRQLAVAGARRRRLLLQVRDSRGCVPVPHCFTSLHTCAMRIFTCFRTSFTKPLGAWPAGCAHVPGRGPGPPSAEGLEARS